MNDDKLTTQTTSSAPRHILLSVLLFEEDDAWAAQALEHNLAAQAPSLEGAQRAFLELLVGQCRLDQQKHREPLAHLPPAPMKYWYAWDRVTQKHLVTTPPASVEPDVTIPPTYVIQAITDAPQFQQTR